MSSLAYALARAELIRALTAYTGIATEDGLGDGTTIVDANLKGKNDFITEKTILIMTGDAQYEDRGASSFDNTTGTITVISAFKDNTGAAAQIKKGTIYRILNISSVEIDVANIKTVVDAIRTQTDKIAGKMLFSMDFWSDPQEEVPVGDAVAGATETLPTVTVADLPTNATIVRAIAMFKFRVIENTNAAANKLNGATVAATSQVIQVDDSVATGFVDAIKFVDDQFSLAAETREGGDVFIGSIDIAARVDGNDTYSVRWLLARADLDYLNFNDVQVGLRIWYSV